METMPYQPTLETMVMTGRHGSEALVSSDWREALPVLSGAQVVLRELRLSDASSLFALLTTEEVARFISPPPTTVEGFERFLTWALEQQAAGAYACFAVTVQGFDTAVGIFQVRQLDPGFERAEWGFALGSSFWGTGVFEQSAALVLRFAFDTLGVHRLEAHALTCNGRGNGALRKLGAVQEAMLARSFRHHGEYVDQNLWAILADEWRLARTVTGARVH